MGREIKRVPLDFDWPLRKPWKGFICTIDEDDPEYEKWERTQPPSGEGYQLWETVSEGSPISPVFATEQEFSAYLIGEGYSGRAVRGFIKVGWCPSMVMTGGRFLNDIESCAEMATD